ncbi:TPA: proQ/FINO family protein, partial [Escherichia coli]|nr:proQ/FINO family protein [Salmonella enterica]EEA1959370.1 proQ/FINO family protein [Salmonella enterica subsp. enterica serovar Heidelberg]HCB3252889.1 proQ/FINO family protein [Escherichia coli]HCN7293071.1 proQ/FINO family protein [Escherichia coli]
SEKTGVIARSETEKMEESVSEGISSPAVDTHTPDAPACKKKKKRRRFPRQPHWTHEFTHDCVEKVKSLFPHLRAEGGGFLPLKIGITNDFAAFLTEHPETELTLDEWSCAISCITTRQVYLQRTAVAGIPRYGLDGLPAGQVSECDALNARRWLAVREQQKLKMKTMQEQSASTEKTER